MRAADDICEKWFLEAGLKANTDSCQVACSTTIVDMGSFICPNQCEELCKQKIPNKLVEPLSYIQGLNEGDKAIIAKYPKDALIVYKAKDTVDDLTQKVFGKAGRNDESDAFRHFIWAGLLVKELGQKRAELFLTAHEQDPGQPASERDMDIANNKMGIEFSNNELKQGNKIELDALEKAALKALKDNRLKVLEPSNKKIPDGYYSK